MVVVGRVVVRVVVVVVAIVGGGLRGRGKWGGVAPSSQTGGRAEMGVFPLTLLLVLLPTAGPRGLLGARL